MSNLFDFLEWRGDLTFAQDPFHDLDALVMTQVSYFTFEEILDRDEEITLAQAWEQMKEGSVSSRFVQKSDKKFLEMLAASERYKDLKICHMAHRLEEEQNVQFAAMTILLPDGTPFLAFRGTDMSLVGWKEDLYMAFSDVIPGQKLALEYLEKRMQEYTGPVYLGGHSKGGNLAMYAATVTSEENQARIKQIYVHDGPGLTEELFHGESYARIKDRLQAILPDQSMVGVLMMHPDEYQVVKSTVASGVLQHNPYTWEVMGTHYVLADGLKKESHYVETVTKKWVEEREEDELREFVEVMFDALKSSEADSIDELVNKIKKNPKLLFHLMKNSDDESRKAFRQTMNLMAETAIQEAKTEFREATSEMKDKGIDFTMKNARKLMEMLPGKNAEEVPGIEMSSEADAAEEPAETGSESKLGKVLESLKQEGNARLEKILENRSTEKEKKDGECVSDLPEESAEGGRKLEKVLESLKQEGNIRLGKMLVNIVHEHEKEAVDDPDAEVRAAVEDKGE